MPWIELQTEIKLSGRTLPAGTRIDYPYHAAHALCASGKAAWVSGPHNRSAPAPEAPESVSVHRVEIEEPEAPIEEAPAPVEEKIAEDAPEPSGPIPPGDFAQMGRDAQKEIILRLGLEDECDLRMPQSMTIAYSAWYGDR